MLNASATRQRSVENSPTFAFSDGLAIVHRYDEIGFVWAAYVVDERGEIYLAPTEAELRVWGWGVRWAGKARDGREHGL